jgi:hypothetical protein
MILVSVKIRSRLYNMMNEIKTKCVVYTLVDTVRIRSRFLRKMLRHLSTMIQGLARYASFIRFHAILTGFARHIFSALYTAENEMKFTIYN